MGGTVQQQYYLHCTTLHQATDVYKAVSLLKQNGFEIGLQLMVGMPGQSFDSVKATVEQVLRLDPSFARIYPLLVIKGTPLEHIYEHCQ